MGKILHAFFAVFLILDFLAVVTSHDHPVPTYFWRRHSNGSLVDRSSPDYNNHLKGHPVLRKRTLNVNVEPIVLTVFPSKSIENGGKVTIEVNDFFVSEHTL